jgi:hypothetical protein
MVAPPFPLWAWLVFVVKPARAARREEERGKVGEGSKAEKLETLTMAPPPCRSITGVTRRAMRTTFSTTRSRAPCHCSSVSSRISPEAGCPVLLTTPSTRPYLWRVPPTRA